MHIDICRNGQIAKQKTRRLSQRACLPGFIRACNLSDCGGAGLIKKCERDLQPSPNPFKGLLVDIEKPSNDDSQTTDCTSDCTSDLQPHLPRRQALRMLALLGGGLVFGSQFAQAEAYERWIDRLRGSSSGSSNTNVRISPELLRALGPQTTQYASYLQRLRLQRVSIEQILRPHANKRGSVQNTLPPQSMWRNIRTTLQVIDQVGRLLGEDVRVVTSAYRSPAYNSSIRGAARESWHLRNNAIDVQYYSSPGRVVEAANALRNRGVFRGGVGRYGSFTHIDTRGENASW